MKIRAGIILLVFLLLASGCHARGLSGTVVDVETGNPIEGAVVLVEWTTTTIAFKSTTTYEVFEVLTDKEGRFSVPGVFNPFVDKPDLTIYKKGYVAWNNRIVFPDYRNRQGFEWKDGYVFELERFKDSYSYSEHTSFISSAADPGSASNKKTLFKKQYYWELKKSSKERDEIHRRIRGSKR